MLVRREQTSLHENTLIIFSADHGEACSSHQMFQKFTLYEENVRVPFIVACLGDGIDVKKHRFDETHFFSGVEYSRLSVIMPESRHPKGAGDEHPSLRRRKDVPWREYVYIESNYWGTQLSPIGTNTLQNINQKWWRISCLPDRLLNNSALSNCSTGKLTHGKRKTLQVR